MVLRRGPDGLEVALIAVRGGAVWALPKGWIEPGEEPEQTASREVCEETGVEARVRQKIDTIRYWYYSRAENVRVAKAVHFFLMDYVSGDTSDHDREVDEARFVPVAQAETLLTYESERDVLRAALRLAD